MKFFSIKKSCLIAAAGLLFATSAPALDLKIATLAPENSHWMKVHRAAAAEIKERTGGQVNFKFYGGGVRGNDRKVLRLIRLGQLQGAAFTTSGLSDRYFDIVLYGLPFTFRSQEEVDFIRKRFDERLQQGLEEAGFVSFGFAGGGFANFMSSDPIASNQNLDGKKIWVPDGDVFSFSALESMELSPVTLPVADVMTGLQTGLIDVIVTPPVGALLLQWYTKISYVNPLPVAYTMGVLGIDKRAFNRLSAEEQQIVSEVLRETYRQLDVANQRDNVDAYAALLANGIKTSQSRAEDVPFWRNIAAGTNQRIWGEKAVDKSLYADMQAALESFRAQRTGEGDVAAANR